ncbi:hypothetical protein GIB67_003727 [Kingdonia uniflora]|uniref:GIGANTEA n=1 Tax=Kingdonia uniflora TaxID=39325 RepID=A0A7J7MSL9_9MAGN|nr:hypothetical protein GIB67_003727 [Kingdonia uniflora]
MEVSSERWIDGLQFSSLFWPPPEDPKQREAQITAYVDYFGQFTSDQFPEDIAELIRSRYPTKVKRLLDEVLAKFVLHHPEHGHAVLLPIISCIIDGTLTYDKISAPFSSFISLVCPSNENEYSEQWALACGEILRVLTHYNRPIYKSDHQSSEAERSSSGSHATTSRSSEGEACPSPVQKERRPLRPLSLWITDILLVAPLGIRSDYFRWCGGVMGKYTTGGELKPPISACVRGSGKHPQLMPSTPRWAVANGAGVILSVCDEEVSRYETATLTAAAVPALLLPPPTTSLDEHLVAGLPALEPYARLFHRYYAIATPSTTQKLLLGLLEAPPSWAPDALDAAVQLVELLRAAEEYASGMRLPRNWMHLHFLRAIGTAMSMRVGIAADTAAALLFRILSQPALLFPPLRQAEAVENENESRGDTRKQVEVPEATVDATAQGIASMFCAHGPEVEWRICTIWEAAYGLIPLSSSAVDLPEIVVASPLQPPVLSWNLYLPLLKVLDYLPRGSPSEACLMRIFIATVEAIVLRTFPPQPSRYETKKSGYLFDSSSTSKNLAVAELRTMIHSLFLESCPSMELSSRLLFVVLTVCLNHEALSSGSKRLRAGGDIYPVNEVVGEWRTIDGKQKDMKTIKTRKQGPVGAFDSYVMAAICALACELQLFPLISKSGKDSDSKDALSKLNGSLRNGMCAAIRHTYRILGILEALFSLKPSSVGTSWSYSSNEIIAAAMVAAHISELFRRSKASMHSLSVLMKCKWDNEIYTRASSLYNLIDVHGKVVASILNKAEPLEAQLLHSPLWNDRKHAHFTHHNLSETVPKCEKSLLSCDNTEHTDRKSVKSGEMDASDLANYLTKDRHLGFSCSAQVLLRSVLAKKQELCISVVSLLWHKLVASPETQLSEESTSAQQGWRQVVDSLCNVVSASPTKASTAIVLQAEKDMQPWIARDDEQGQMMWIINQRILKLIVELMRNHDNPESWVIIASASDLLLRATDGMLIDGKACTLPQLEVLSQDLLSFQCYTVFLDKIEQLLEATAKTIHRVLEWGNIGSPVMDSLSNLLKCRLPAITQCLSHPSAHVRAFSMSVLREILVIGSFQPGSKVGNISAINGSGQKSNLEFVNWRADIEKCFLWEAQRRHNSELIITFLNDAARELGFTISC